MIKNLILDIGNVICEWNPDRLSASVTDNAADKASVMDATINHPDWLNIDRGLLSVEDAIVNAQKRADLDDATVAGIYHNLPESMWLIESTAIAMARASKAGIPIYILSNMQHHVWRYLRSAHPCFALCTGVVVSCEVGVIKPDKKIYDHLCKRFSLEPSECIFIDDMLENVEAARACGWHSEQLVSISDSETLINQVIDNMVASR